MTAVRDSNRRQCKRYLNMKVTYGKLLLSDQDNISLSYVYSVWVTIAESKTGPKGKDPTKNQNKVLVFT